VRENKEVRGQYCGAGSSFFSSSWFFMLLQGLNSFWKHRAIEYKQKIYIADTEPIGISEYVSNSSKIKYWGS
jgi:hypothetical protein